MSMKKKPGEKNEKKILYAYAAGVFDGFMESMAENADMQLVVPTDSRVSIIKNMMRGHVVMFRRNGDISSIVVLNMAGGIPAKPYIFK